MDAGVAHVASAVAMLVHTTLVPAGAGTVAALVVVSRHPTTSAPWSLTSPQSRRATTLRALAARDQLSVVRPQGDVLLQEQAVDRPDPPAPTRATLAWRLAAVCTIASGAVHAVATPHHATENVVFGVFFLVSAVGQFGWATVALTCPSPALLRHGIALNVLLVELWVVTRTTGLPFGLQNGPEGVGTWDVAAKVWELGALACLLHLMLAGDTRTSTRARHGSVYLQAAVATSVVALLVLALAGPPA